MRDVNIQPLIDAASNYIYFSMVMEVLEPFLVLGVFLVLGHGVFNIIKWIVRNS